MPINSFLYPGAKVTSAYEVANSLRFNSGSSDYLSNTNSTPTNNDICTFSFWIKFSKESTNAICSAHTDGANRFQIFHLGGSQLQIFQEVSDTTNINLKTNRLFRDISAWYHIVYEIDTTQSTDSNRIKMYVNGVQETSFSTETYPSQNDNIRFNTNSLVQEIGRANASDYGSYYLAEFVFVDGTALDQTSFGEFDSDSPTIWKPKDVSGLTLGNNGFYLDFENSSGLGNDATGTNHFAVNNLTAVDQSTDTCTNNFCTLNSLDNYYQDDTLSEGNIKMVGGSRHAHRIGTFGLSTGKWYFEVQVNNFQSSDQTGIGIAAEGPTSNDYETYNQSGSNVGYVYYSNGAVYGGGSTIKNSGVFSSGSGTHIIGVALNLTDSKIAWSYDGTWQGSTDPGAGNTNMTSITATSSLIHGVYFPAVKQKANNRILSMNFGSPSFSISSGNSDANGYGNFEYAVPSGYYAINSKNLAEFG
jgi:hypothetical protein